MTLTTANATDDRDPLEDIDIAATITVLDGLEKGLSRLPADDRHRPILLQIRRGLLAILGRDPFSAPPAVDQLETILTISHQAVAARRRRHHREES